MKQTDLDSNHTRSNQPPSRSYGFAQSNTPSVRRNPAHPQGTQTLTRMQSTRVFVNTDPQVIVAASSNRNYLLIQNNGTSDVLLGFGVIPNLDGSNAMVLASGSQYDFSSGIVPNNEVYAVSSASNSISINDGTMV